MKLRKVADTVYEVLKKGGIWTVLELSEEIGVTPARVRLGVAKLRKMHRSSKHPELSYVYTTGVGYSIEEKPEFTAYESMLRMRQGHGTLSNGIYVFQRCQQLAPKMFDQLSELFKPKMVTIQKMITIQKFK